MSATVCGTSRIISFPEESGSISGSVTLNNEAWSVIDWDPLLDYAIRGTDLLIPGADGLVARDRYTTILQLSLQMVFDGNIDNAGTPYTAPTTVAEGLEMNRQAFITAAVAPPASPATRTLNLTLADGDAVSGSFHCEGFQFRKRGDGLAVATWRISLPDGPLT